MRIEKIFENICKTLDLEPALSDMLYHVGTRDWYLKKFRRARYGQQNLPRLTKRPYEPQKRFSGAAGCFAGGARAPKGAAFLLHAISSELILNDCHEGGLSPRMGLPFGA